MPSASRKRIGTLTAVSQYDDAANRSDRHLCNHVRVGGMAVPVIIDIYRAAARMAFRTPVGCVPQARAYSWLADQSLLRSTFDHTIARIEMLYPEVWKNDKPAPRVRAV